MSPALARLLLSGWQVTASIDAGGYGLYSYDLAEQRFVYTPPTGVLTYLRVSATLVGAGDVTHGFEGTLALPTTVPLMDVLTTDPRLEAWLDEALTALLDRVMIDKPELLAPKEGE